MLNSHTYTNIILFWNREEFTTTKSFHFKALELNKLKFVSKKKVIFRGPNYLQWKCLYRIIYIKKDLSNEPKYSSPCKILAMRFFKNWKNRTFLRLQRKPNFFSFDSIFLLKVVLNRLVLYYDILSTNKRTSKVGIQELKN